jgi:hypothetical protein
VFRAQATTPNVRIGRSLADGATVPPLELSNVGDFRQLVTDQFENLAVTRHAFAQTGFSMASGTDDTGEFQVTNFNDFVSTRRVTDRLAIWFEIDLTVDNGGANILPTPTTTFAKVTLRRGPTFAASVNVGEFLLSTTSMIPTIRDAATLVRIQEPSTIGAHTFWIAARMGTQSPSGGSIPSFSFTVRLLIQATSA